MSQLMKQSGADGKQFGTEERFRNLNKSQTDNLYYLPKIDNTKSVIFPSASRDDTGGSRLNMSQTGPGSYDISKGFDCNSEYPTKKANRFATYPRQSMAMKTPSPGAIYQIENQYWNGPTKSLGIGFNTDPRFPETKGQDSNTGGYMPKYETGKAITMGQRVKMIEPGSDTPGPIYNAHVIKLHKAPAYSFGKTKGNRFKQAIYLPEPPDTD